MAPCRERFLFPSGWMAGSGSEPSRCRCRTARRRERCCCRLERLSAHPGTARRQISLPGSSFRGAGARTIPIDAAKSPSGSADDPAAESPEDPSTGKAPHPDKTPRPGICRLIAVTVGAEMEKLPGGRGLCSFRLRDGGGEKATFLLNELVNAGEECH